MEMPIIREGTFYFRSADEPTVATYWFYPDGRIQINCNDPFFTEWFKKDSIDAGITEQPMFPSVLKSSPYYRLNLLILAKFIEILGNFWDEDRRAQLNN